MKLPFFSEMLAEKYVESHGMDLSHKDKCGTTVMKNRLSHGGVRCGSKLQKP